MLEKANMTVFETIYGFILHGEHSAMQSGNCAPHYKNGAGPRSTHLGGADGEDSGGIRWVNDAIYNGGTYITGEGEDWGPGTTWACLSWRTIMETFQETHQHQMIINGIQCYKNSNAC